MAAFPLCFYARRCSGGKGPATACQAPGILAAGNMNRAGVVEGLLAAVTGLGAALASFGCSSVLGDNATGSCTPGDSDGISGGPAAVVVVVSDSAFAVGGVDSGSTERNITLQNLANVTLTLTNVGTRPHDLVVACIPSGLPAGCTQTSCFPADAGASGGYVTIVPALAPGTSITVMFTAPAVEGVYPFLSNESGDTQMASDGGVSGLAGAFVLM
jgi:hypothetical protein